MPSAERQQTLHARALEEFAAGAVAEAQLLLEDAVDALDLEAVNDLAVIASGAGDHEKARRLLDAVLALQPSNAEAYANRELLGDGSADRDWRSSPTISGPDPAYFERAFPGMPRPDTMAEHCARYSWALGLVGGLDVLDLGCGTGYGSEMLTWSARSVRGFDLWEPSPSERPRWSGGAVLAYGHDLCRDPLPRADAAVMFEVIEHLHDAPGALRIAWSSVDALICSFPNPRYHGSWMNKYHVTDWTLDEFEGWVRTTAGSALELVHVHQPVGSPLLALGRDPEASFWEIAARRAW